MSESGKVWTPLLAEIEFYEKRKFWPIIGIIIGIIALCVGVTAIFIEKEAPWYLLVLMVIVLFLTVNDTHTLVRGRVVTDYAKQSHKCYLSGYTLWEFMNGRVFERLANYIGHGLCYEVAALNMILLEENYISRFVIAEVDRHGGRTRHAWVEFRAYGFWWTVDPNWDDKFIRLRFRHNRKIRAKYQRIISHQEFWNFGIANDFYECLSKRETSHLFLELIYFHATDRNEYELLFEAFGRTELNNSGENWDYRMVWAHEEDRPITDRILKHFLHHPFSVMPKKRDFRRARCFAKNLKRAFAAAAEHKEKTGEKVIIALDSLKSFHLETKQQAEALE